MYYTIEQLAPGLKNIDATFIVLQKVDDRILRDGKELVRYRVADKTGSVILPLFQPFIGHVQGGDILKLSNGYATIYEKRLHLYVGPGTIQKIGEFTMTYTDSPDMSKEVNEGNK
eukprot:m.113949 g.113949  ORF g.113949 m.113949 type:complete len:115 (+) comp12806_c1_seq1:42-386(+)